MTITSLPPRTDTDPPVRLTRAGAEELGVRIQEQAARIAEATCRLLLMVGDFDARGGSGWYVGLKSTAHWLSWACSMSPGTAREHVRVARALRSMPLTVAEFSAGRLSYSKVREITRVADRVEETMLVEFARAMTASQLARTISTFRAVDGSRLGQDAVRQARWQTREDGMVEIRAVLPAEMGAELVTALDLALDRDGHEPERVPAHSQPPGIADDPDADEEVAEDAAEVAARMTATPTLEQRKADALAALARTFLDAEPNDRSGEDRHLVIVQVSAEALTRDVPAGTTGAPAPADLSSTTDPSTPTDPSATPAEPASTPATPPTASPPLERSELDPAAVPTVAPAAERVPAGTSQHCGVVGQGPLETRTAERLACTGKVAIAITDAGGEVLHLGRSQRLASRAQRRALRLRDGTCSFPGCHQSRHLDAHHTTPWSQGGLTDIESLALLCRRHHVMVHEGGLRLVLAPTRPRGQSRFQVLDEHDRPVQARWPAILEHLSTRDTTPTAVERTATATGDGDTVEADAAQVSSPARETDPERIAATTRGAGFRLADCVDALCQNVLRLAA